MRSSQANSPSPASYSYLCSSMCFDSIYEWGWGCEIFFGYICGGVLCVDWGLATKYSEVIVSLT